ncbi:hypothetical protein E3P99_01462 [Wallemia hederae]|uniref:AP complex subunit beta n=1 Tax=Wallemia hederae TaxID=1540922 RepID=A0A4T0FSP2_9BASI|nr:hypothetical protein E3P99_01462 [Wallemia hederae]
MSSTKDKELYSKLNVYEVKQQLNDTNKRDKNYASLKHLLKKVIANITMGYDLSGLYKDVVQHITIKDIQIKKLVYTYLITYAKHRPDLIHHPIAHLLNDCADRNPLTRSLALRTMSYIQLPFVSQSLLDPLRHCLSDADPYVRKTAAISLCKLYFSDPSLVEKQGLIRYLRDLLADSNAAVVANAVAALCEIANKSDNIQLKLNITIANKLVNALAECSEWGQVYILESLLHFIPQTSQDATFLTERIATHLQHSNSAVVLSSTKTIIYLFNYIQDHSVIDHYSRKLSPPLITLLSSPPEVQYVALRNILLIIQRRPQVLYADVKIFFVKYLDPIYVKLAKLEIIYRLTRVDNYVDVLAELSEYATEVDVDFVRKAIKLIGRLAIKIDEASDASVKVLLSLLETGITYVVQETMIVFRDIFRKYPTQYTTILPQLIAQMDALDDNESKSSMIWLIGEYADVIPNSNELLDDFLFNFLQEHAEVQLSLLTATVKLFIKTPHQGQDLVPRVLGWATEQMDNPDIRDRAFLYWRLLSNDPNAAKEIVLAAKPTISTDADRMDRSLLDIGELSSVYHKQPTSFIRNSKARYLPDSPCLDTYARRAAQAASARHEKPSPLPSVPSPDIPSSTPATPTSPVSPASSSERPMSELHMRPMSVAGNLLPQHLSDGGIQNANRLTADLSRMSVVDSPTPQSPHSPHSPSVPFAYTSTSPDLGASTPTQPLTSAGSAGVGAGAYTPLSPNIPEQNDPSNPYAALGDAFDDSPVLHSKHDLDDLDAF